MQNGIYFSVSLHGNLSDNTGRHRRNHPQDLSVHHWRCIAGVNILDSDNVRSRHCDAGTKKSLKKLIIDIFSHTYISYLFLHNSDTLSKSDSLDTILF